jgi:hypothetical protein
MPIFIALLQSLIQISTLDKPTTRFPCRCLKGFIALPFDEAILFGRVTHYL